MPAKLNIEAYAGDTFATVITVRTEDENGVFADVDFSGASAVMALKYRKRDTDAVITLTTSNGGITFPATSQIGINLSAFQTTQVAGVDLYYDLQVTDSGGTVRTYIEGIFNAKNDV